MSKHSLLSLLRGNDKLSNDDLNILIHEQMPDKGCEAGLPVVLSFKNSDAFFSYISSLNPKFKTFSFEVDSFSLETNHCNETTITNCFYISGPITYLDELMVKLDELS